MMVTEHLLFKNDRHIRKVFEALNEQRQTARFTDAVLKVGLADIKLHRCILAAAIPKLLENQDGEDESLLTVKLEGVDPNAVEVLVEFAYTGELSVSAGEVLGLYHAAKSLGMKDVQDSCEQFVLDKVLPLDWMAVRGFAEQQDCPNLMIAVDKFVEEHVGEIYHKKDFFQLPRLQIELASTNDRQRESIDSENLCNVAINWAHKQLEVRLYYSFMNDSGRTIFHLLLESRPHGLPVRVSVTTFHFEQSARSCIEGEIALLLVSLIYYFLKRF